MAAFFVILVVNKFTYYLLLITYLKNEWGVIFI
jgi:hypothetical protein